MIAYSLERRAVLNTLIISGYALYFYFSVLQYHFFAQYSNTF